MGNRLPTQARQPKILPPESMQWQMNDSTLANDMLPWLGINVKRSVPMTINHRQGSHLRAKTAMAL